MLDVTLCILAVVGGSMALELFAAATAPLGYQDEQGFHFGPEPAAKAEEHQICSPS